VSVEEVRVPDIGDFADVPVIEIHVSAGDEVAVEDPLVTLESDKATMDVPSPSAGVIKQLSVGIGDRVSEGSLLVTIESNSAGASTETEAAEPEDERRPAGLGDRSPAGDAGADGGHDAQVVVIGAGPGGYSAAFRAADLGLKTTLIERHETLGGVCLNVGCIPSKALLHAARVIAEAQEMAAHGIEFGSPRIELDALRNWKESAVAKLTGGLEGLARKRNVEVVRGVARLEGPNTVAVGERTISFDSCIIAAGSRATSLPDLPEDPRIMDSTAALGIPAVPKRLLVIGGGIIGLEMATVYEALGARITVVEMLDRLIAGCDPDLVRPLAKRIEERYEAVLLETRVEAVEARTNALAVKLSNGETQEFDGVLVAVGRRANGHEVGAQDAGVEVEESGVIPVDAQLRTNVPSVYAVGDVTGEPLLAHRASHQGKMAAEAIAGVAGAEFDARAVPAVAYTDPEIAWMGLNETEARERGVEYEKSVFPWAASGRALTLARDEGMTKLLFESRSRRLLGAGIVGVGAGELIAETVHALEMGSVAEDIALTIHPHPTLTETVGFASELAQGTITDLMPKR